SSRDIAEAASEAGHDITRGQVRLDAPIKTIGVYDVRVRLHADVYVTVQVNVARSTDEAERQAKGEDVLATAQAADRAAALAERTSLSEEEARRLFEEGAAPELGEEAAPAEAEASGAEASEGEAAEQQ